MKKRQPPKKESQRPDSAKFSTATEAQRHRILDMLRTGPKTTLDFRRAGVLHPCSAKVLRYFIQITGCQPS
mgnify:CR=1 FL=1